jgi:hypothetical protein
VKNRFIFLFILSTSLNLYSQPPEISDELKMTFPSIYFKNNSVEYAEMPYTTDSCFKYITGHKKEVGYMVVWHDPGEPDVIAIERLDKVKNEIAKYHPEGKIHFVIMSEESKLSKETIEKARTPEEKKYLLALNSVIDYSPSRINKNQGTYYNHIWYPRPWCLACWKHGFHTRQRKLLREAKRIEEQKKRQRQINSQVIHP